VAWASVRVFAYKSLPSILSRLLARCEFFAYKSPPSILSRGSHWHWQGASFCLQIVTFHFEPVESRTGLSARESRPSILSRGSHSFCLQIVTFHFESNVAYRPGTYKWPPSILSRGSHSYCLQIATFHFELALESRTRPIGLGCMPVSAVALTNADLNCQTEFPQSQLPRPLRRPQSQLAHPFHSWQFSSNQTRASSARTFLSRTMLNYILVDKLLAVPTARVARKLTSLAFSTRQSLLGAAPPNPCLLIISIG
jgi:hypothetical protein